MPKTLLTPQTLHFNGDANPDRGQYETTQQIHEKDAGTYANLWTSSTQAMRIYVIGIGWDGTYLAQGSTRLQYGTCEDRQVEFRQRIRQAAAKAEDTIIAWRKVYAHEIRHVRQCYPDAVTV